MPRKPNKPCAHPGCPQMVSVGSSGGGRFCEVHARQDTREYERYRRDPETRKRYGQVWRRIRARYIASHSICEMCRREGQLTPATQVHHIKPLAEGGTHNEGNLMALCASCHSGITLAENNRRR